MKCLAQHTGLHGPQLLRAPVHLKKLLKAHHSSRVGKTRTDQQRCCAHANLLQNEAELAPALCSVNKLHGSGSECTRQSATEVHVTPCATRRHLQALEKPQPCRWPYSSMNLITLLATKRSLCWSHASWLPSEWMCAGRGLLRLFVSLPFIPPAWYRGQGYAEACVVRLHDSAGSISLLWGQVGDACDGCLLQACP
eukprot:1160610-Pelagomonas_calceolata.AAC.6